MPSNDAQPTKRFNSELLDSILKKVAPELGDLWIQRKDEFEEEGIRTGRLHENHILGIILSADELNQKHITTQDIENLYKDYFKKIARSTVSTYLNQLDKEGVLGKDRKGRIVYYFLEQKPPSEINPFWIVRNFCILPAYFARANYIARFYDITEGIPKDLIDSRNFIVGLALLILFKHRISKCMLCQFGSRNDYRELKNTLEMILKDRMDVLPEPLQKFIEEDLGELPIFGGLEIPEKVNDEEINKKINDLVIRFAQDIDFQINVSKRRQELRMKQKSKQ